MSATEYNPEQHHRRSIRLKGHDYSGGGLYFVTICAHREFKAWAGNSPFAGAMKKIIEERIAITAAKFPQAQWQEWVIMPDHFHALIRMDAGPSRLGDIMGGFKSAASREFRRAQKASQDAGGLDSKAMQDSKAAMQALPVRARPASPPFQRPASPPSDPASPLFDAPFAGRIWHRNYYEVIVRSAEAAEKIAEYIRMNPWRCVQAFGKGLRGMGNPALWNAEKLGVLCSRNAPKPDGIPSAPVYLSGFHSPMEKRIFARLLEAERPMIWCPAWGLDRAASDPAVRQALEKNRMLILEMRDVAGDLAAAEARNRFVIQHADTMWTPHVNPGGMLDRLLKENGIPK